MSGGSYDYVSDRIGETASRLRSYHPDEPHVLALARHLDDIAKVMHDIEWADSCDTSWTPDLDAKIRSLLAPDAELQVAAERAQTAYDQLGRVLETVKR